MTRPSTPVFFLLPALALMPVGRLVEAPYLALAILGLAVSVSGALRLREGMAPTTLQLYACFAVPMLLALPDAVNLEKSLMTLIGSLRFVCATLGLLWLLRIADDPQRARNDTLYWVGAATSLLLTLWCLDGLWQFLSGRDIFGYALNEGYINSVFGDGENLKFGITLALLLPLGLVHVLRHWRTLPAAAFLLLTLLLLLLSGKRAAWIVALLQFAGLALYYWHRGRFALRRVMVVAALITVAIVAAYSASDWVQSRSQVLVAAVDEPDYETLNRASGLRLPIWKVAADMASDHWFNGVGPRGFRYAYNDYADADDHWSEALATGGARASHAHQLILEIACETGVAGLLGFLLMLVILVNRWRLAGLAARSRALPYALSLLGMLFPVNTHAAWYSSWSGLMLWFFIGLYLVALAEPAQEPATP